MTSTLRLSPEADSLDVLLRTRRLPASILTEEQRDGARELIDLGLARTFTDGPDEWLETIPADERETGPAAVAYRLYAALEAERAGEDNLEGQRRSDVLAAAEALEASLYDDLDVELFTGQLVVAMPGQLELS